MRVAIDLTLITCKGCATNVIIENQAERHIDIMSKELDMVKKVIKDYLDQRAQTDELFAEVYAKPNKSIDECMEFIMGEARHLGGNVVCVPDDVVFGWAVHYYDEDDIMVEKISDSVRVGTSVPMAELSEEDKRQAHERAMSSYEQMCIRKLEEAKKEKARKASEKRKIDAEASASMTQSLFAL